MGGKGGRMETSPNKRKNLLRRREQTDPRKA
jgi:hypothetical protein